MGFSGWMSKQFGHDLVGFYTDNNELCSVVANQYTVKNGAKLFAGAYTDNLGQISIQLLQQECRKYNDRKERYTYSQVQQIGNSSKSSNCNDSNSQ